MTFEQWMESHYGDLADIATDRRLSFLSEQDIHIILRSALRSCWRAAHYAGTCSAIAAKDDSFFRHCANYVRRHAETIAPPVPLTVELAGEPVPVPPPVNGVLERTIGAMLEGRDV